MARIIGITGGIGSGKSFISSQLRDLGYTVYDTDSEAKRLIIYDSAVRKAVETLLGPDVFDGEKYLTRVVAERVFANPSLLAGLNAIVHPAVKDDILRKATDAEGVFFVESALLFDSDIDSICDAVICVTAPEEVRIRRVMMRDYTDTNHIRARIRAQKEESAKADLIVVNDGEHSISQMLEPILALIS